MDFVRCEKGHFYDASQNSTCPQCAAEAAGGMGGIGPTAPIAGGAGFGDSGPVAPIAPTEPVGGYGDGTVGPTAPVMNQGFTPTDFAPASGNMGSVNPGGVQSYGSTQPVWPGGTSGFNPVVGWLVCVDGPDKGTDYRIHTGYNYIGRAQHMDICILNDSHISHDKHASIAHDTETNIFFFAPVNGRNIIRVNDKPVINSAELHPYDMLTIGTTKLCFVPFCCDKFSWVE